MPGGREQSRSDGARHSRRSDSAPIVLVDSCVWHHSFSRNTLRHLALNMAIRIRWSRSIESEWIASVLRARPEIERSTLIQVRDRFRIEFPDGLASETIPRHAVPRLPDPDDEHVLRAAISVGATILCTLDRRGFPRSALAPHGITALRPDALIAECVAKRTTRSVTALHVHRTSLTRPSFSPDEYVEALRKAHLVPNSTVGELVRRELHSRAHDRPNAR
jgi:predicted nucleic acid-binding protein